MDTAKTFVSNVCHTVKGTSKPEIIFTLTPLEACKFSYLAYYSKEEIEKGLKSPDDIFETLKEHQTEGEITFISSDLQDAQAIVSKMKKRCADGEVCDYVLLACRGTDSMRDVINDLQCALVPFDTPLAHKAGATFKGCAVHAGILTSYQSIEADVYNAVREYMEMSPTIKLVCTGHSLGASSSLLAAYIFNIMYPGRVEYMGIGSPRSVNKCFRDTFDCKSKLLLKNGRDPITKILEETSDGYNHVCDMTHIGCHDFNVNNPNLLYFVDHDIKDYIRNAETDRVPDHSLLHRLLCMFETTVRIFKS